jgi:hypothetical protein
MRREGAAIDVETLSSADPLEFRVTAHEGRGSTEHRVTMSAATHRKLAGQTAAPEDVIRAAFAFLLDREPKESILSRFDVTVISRYFPEFERELPKYLPRADS